MFHFLRTGANSSVSNKHTTPTLKVPAGESEFSAVAYDYDYIADSQTKVNGNNKTVVFFTVATEPHPIQYTCTIIGGSTTTRVYTAYFKQEP